MTEKQLVTYDITEAAISKMSSEFMPLTVAGLDDKEGLTVVHDARMVVKTHRVAVEKRRKALKADALAYGKKVDTKAKIIFALLEPIESHLQAEEDKVKIELEWIAAAKAEVERVKIQDRIDAFLEYNVTLPYFEVAAMTDEEFADRHSLAVSGNEAEQARFRAEEVAREAEDERLRLERESQDAIAKELLEAQAKLDADREALEREKQAEIDRKAAEQAKIDAAEQAKKDAAEKVELEAKERMRQYALKPDKEKLLEFLDGFDTMLEKASEIDLSVEASQLVLEEIVGGITEDRSHYIQKINAL